MTTSEQLAALARLHELLQTAGIDYWLFGGWAVDFHAGAVTREHFDVDTAVWLSDVPRIAQLLAAEGWQHAPQADEDGGTGYERGTVRIELTFLVRGHDGGVLIPLNAGPFRWSADDLLAEERQLLGVRARVLGLAELTRGKAAPRDDPSDAAKDRADFRVLSGLG